MQNLNNNPQEINQTYKQSNFIGFENFIELENQVSQTKEKSKLSKIGKKLPGISSQECFRFNRNIDFSLQRSKLDKYGASEVGTVVIGGTGLKDLMVNRVLKYFGVSLPFEENLYMLKGKELENLGFREFIKAHGDNIAVLYKNKYANGVDKYNYFKKMENSKTLVGSTIDGWFMNIYGDLELLEIKSSDSHYMRSAIEEYNKNGNFLSSQYFFKYYVQAQIQLACTGLEYCNLFFLIDAAPVNCKIKRNDSLISKVLNFVLKCEREVFNIRAEIVKNNQVKLLISNNIDNDMFNKLVEEIEELVVKSDFY
uniref:YqaJ viral recombinase family protein n=1 Tax=Borreliella valaisiana TaxID=62088 RepID=UPI001AED58B4